MRGEIFKNYKAADKRLIFLDYDGTLTGFKGNPQMAKPDKELYDILQGLIDQPQNRIVVVSGRDKSTLEEWLGHLPIEFIAEHGVWKKELEGKWKTITKLTGQWKDEIRKVLEGYVNRTPGSFIEEKDYSIVWHYRKVETGLGEIRTRELTSHLNYLAGNKNLQVLEGHMVVEIKNSEINKGRAATQWVDKYKSAFVMAIGDDWTDEDTFEAMPDHAVTIKVGSSASAAKYSLTSPTEVRKLLADLGKV
ncbi:MAG: trehalose-phosphatase [Cyclobacteriaceae bacterium]